MSFRNWLLAGTSMTILAFAPMSVARAQDAANPTLVSAYNAYQADQSDANREALTEACIVAGFASLEDCLAALSASVTPPPAPAPSAEPEPEPEPAVSEEPPPPPPPVEEQPAPPPVEEPAMSEEAPPAPPVEEPAVVSEEPAVVSEEPSVSEEPAVDPNAAILAELTAAVALYNEGAAQLAAGDASGQAKVDEAQARIDAACSTAGFADSASCLANFGLTLSPLPAPVTPSEEPAMSAEEPAMSAEEPAMSTEEPAVSSEEPMVSSEEPAVSSEEPAVSSEEPAVSSEEPAQPAASAELVAAVDLYNQGVTELSGGNAEGQAKVDQAQAQIDQLCIDAGFPDTQACLDAYGLALAPLPTVVVPPIAELPGADEPVTDDAVVPLPPTVAEGEAGFVLDSATDNVGTVTEEPTTPDQPSEEPAPPAEPQPVPETVEEAQADLPPPAEDDSVTTTEVEPLPEFTPVRTEVATEDPAQAPDANGFLLPPPQEPTAEGDQQIQIVQAPTAQNPSFVFQIGIHIYITNIERERDRFYDRREDEIYYERLRNGRIRETIERPNGVRIVTVYNRYGDVLKRTKIYPDNREFYIADFDGRGRDDDRDYADSFFIDPGEELPPLRLTIPVREYILDADSADEEDVEFFLKKPPVEKVRRIYSIDEVKRSSRLRDSVRRLEVGNLTFDSGKATIARSQVGALSKVAKAMLSLLDDNPAEVFLIEGHTDATGSDLANLELSDQRASTVARILTEFYDVPPENLVTQGYGERYLKVKTEAAEPLNRRVVVKRITPLVTRSR